MLDAIGRDEGAFVSLGCKNQGILYIPYILFSRDIEFARESIGMPAPVSVSNH